MKWRVLITCPQLLATIDNYRSIFAENSIEIETPDVVQQLTEPQLLDIIDPFHGVIAGDDEFTARVMEKGRNLKVIARWGIGLDGVDLTAAERMGITVSNTPNVFSDEAADVVMAYIVLLSRQLHRLDQGVRDGDWPKIRGVSIRDKTLGIIGMGNIGRAVAHRALAAGMSILGYDVYPIPDMIEGDSGPRMVTLDKLLAASDYISLNCNLTDTNRHILGTDQFALMKEGVYIINAARGPLIDEDALAQSLAKGKVSGAALDVFETEPLPAESLLRRFENCIFGTHNSSNTYEAVMRVNELAIQNLIEGLAGSDQRLG
jgi:D-3-phosphoglycerate dehydrogenase